MALPDADELLQQGVAALPVEGTLTLTLTRTRT